MSENTNKFSVEYIRYYDIMKKDLCYKIITIRLRKDFLV